MKSTMILTTKIKYLIHLFYLSIIFISVVGSINYCIDPAQLFSSGSYEQGVAKSLLSGYNVTRLSNNDERLVQRAYVNNLQERKDVIILGSSRSLHIRKELFPGMTFFNNGVSGASIEDYFAIYELYEQRNLPPSIVVLGFDPWILNKYNGQSRWMSLKREYVSIASRLGIEANDNTYRINLSNKLIELFSFPYFKESLKRLFWDRKKDHEEYYSTLNDLGDDAGILSDGSRVYSREARNVSPDEIRMSAIKYVSGDNIYSLFNFKCLDKKIMLSLEKFVEYLQSKNIEIILYLPPYHPYVFNFFSESKKYRKVLEAENYFRKLANDKGITIVGGYNPENSDCGPGDFFDGAHPKESCLNNALKNVLKLMPR